MNKINKYKKYITSYKVVKTSLKSVIKNKKLLYKIEDAVNRSNKIIIHTLHFLKLYYLYNVHKYNKYVTINGDLIDAIIKITAINILSFNIFILLSSK